MMRTLWALLWCVGLSACAGQRGLRKLTAEELTGGDPLPLAQDATWAYRVKQTTYDPISEKETTFDFDWTTKVVAVTEADGFTAYRIKGWIADAKMGGTPSERVLIRAGDRFLWAKSTAAGDASATVAGAEGWFAWPLSEDQKICSNPDTEYCWRVESSPYGYFLRAVEGRDLHEYLMQPGTGVASYKNSNEGTTDRLQATLTDYRPGRPAKRP